MDTQIYIIAHKEVPYGIWNNTLYTPIQVGINARFLQLRDSDYPDNVAQWNATYAENTATYTIAKNLTQWHNYVGQCQYRRRIRFDENTDFDAIFSQYDVICTEPLRCNPFAQYVACHTIIDLLDAYAAICELYPEYKNAWRKYIVKGDKLYYSNSFVLPAAEYRRYARFLFSIIDWIRAKRGYSTPAVAKKKIKAEISAGIRMGSNRPGYALQWAGFLSERLWTMWVQANYGRIMEKEWTKYENV